MSRCPECVPPTKGASEGLAFTKPHLNQPGARCELEAEHRGAHRAGSIKWWEPPIIVSRRVST